MKEITIDGVVYTPKTEKVQKNNLTYCIVRTYSAGVFAGYYDLKTKGKEGVVIEARRLWKWEGAASLSQLASEGTSKPSECKFPCEVKELYLKEIIEIIPITNKAKKSINSVPVWSK